MFCDDRKLAEEWTYRYLAAAYAWASGEVPAVQRMAIVEGGASGEPWPSTAEVRAWARAHGLVVPDRGRLRPAIHQAWRDAPH